MCDRDPSACHFYHVPFHLELDAPVFIRHRLRSLHFGYLFGGAHGARDDCNKSADKTFTKMVANEEVEREREHEGKIPLLNGVINFLFE